MARLGLGPGEETGRAAQVSAWRRRGSGLVLISNEQRNGRLADELYMSVLLPPEMRATPDASVDEFMADVAAMKERLDRERKDENGSGG